MHWAQAILRKTLVFNSRNRFALAIVFASVALATFLYRSELTVPPEASLDRLEIQAEAIGIMQVSVLGKRDRAVVAERQAGHAIQFRAPTENSLLALAGPIVMPFADELALTTKEVKWLAGQGPSFQIGILRGKIVTVASHEESLIPYIRYTRAITTKRRLLLAVTALLVLTGAALFYVGHRQRPRTDA